MHFPGSRDHMWSRRTLGKGTFESTTATTDWEGLRHGDQVRFHRRGMGDPAEGRHGRGLLDDHRRPRLLRHVQGVERDGEAPRRRAPELGEHSGARPRRHEGHGLRLAVFAGGDRRRDDCRASGRAADPGGEGTGRAARLPRVRVGGGGFCGEGRRGRRDRRGRDARADQSRTRRLALESRASAS